MGAVKSMHMPRRGADRGCEYPECVSQRLRLQPWRCHRQTVALALAARLAADRDTGLLLLSPLCTLLKDALAERLCGVTQNSDPLLAAARERWNAEQLSAKLQAIEQAQEALHSNCNPALVFEVLLLELLGCYPHSRA